MTLVNRFRLPVAHTETGDLRLQVDFIHRAAPFVPIIVVTAMLFTPRLISLEHL
jgi:hypothetical protein